jgi:hypothetical protein
MEKEYRDIILAGEALLEKVTGRKWERGTTGGGCDAFFHTLPYAAESSEYAEAYYMVTYAEDASIPVNDEEWQNIHLGFYIGDECEPETSIYGTIDDIAEHFNKLGGGECYGCRILRTEDRVVSVDEAQGSPVCAVCETIILNEGGK